MGNIALIGGTKAFRLFLSHIGVKVHETSIENGIRDEHYTAMILLPYYEHGEEYVEELSLELLEVLAKRKLDGFKVYAENY